MFCTHCGNQIPDNSSFCPNCGRTVEQQPVQQPTYQPEQPVYRQPEQPVYQQPVQQPVYQQPVGQPMYQQPAQQPQKKSSAGKTVLIVVLCLIGIPLILLASCFGCAACFANELETELENSGYTTEDFEDALADLEDALEGIEDINPEDFDFDYDTATAEVSAIEGTWIHHMAGEEMTLTVTSNGDGTYTVEGDDFVEFFYGERGDAEMTISNCAVMGDPLCTGELEMKMADYYDLSMTVLYSEYTLEFWYEGYDPYCFFKKTEDFDDSTLAEDIIGTWACEDAFTIIFEEGGVGEYIEDGQNYYSSWYCFGDYITVTYDVGEDTYWFSYYVKKVGNKLMAYATFYEDTVEFSDARWDYIPYRRVTE